MQSSARSISEYDKTLTLKVPITVTADDILKYFYENKEI